MPNENVASVINCINCFSWFQPSPHSYLDILRQKSNALDPDKETVLREKYEALQNWVNISPYPLDLSFIDLSGIGEPIADILKGKVSNANLKGANLEGLNLSGLDFNGAKLKGARLRGACLLGANLSGANLKGADLILAQMTSVKLSGANLSGANLRYANLSGAADLSNACLIGADLLGANLRGSNLSGADLSDAGLSDADLRETDLSHVKLINTSLMGVALSLTNLATLDNIRHEYADQKIKLAQNIIALCIKRSVSLSDDVVASLLDIFCKAPYNTDKKINTWLKDTVCPQYLKKYNSSVMPMQHEHVLDVLVSDFENDPYRMFIHNAAFIQLVSQVIYSDISDSLKGKVKNIYDNYLKNEKNSHYINQCGFGSRGKNKRELNWSESGREACNFILFSAVNDATNDYVMVLSQNNLKKMLASNLEGNMKWDHFFLYKGGKPSDQPGDLFKNHFKVFHSNYQESVRAVLSRLLKALGLSGELYDLFLSATQQATSTKKLVNSASYNKLAEIFMPQLEIYFDEHERYCLKNECYEKLLQVYDLSTVDDTKQAEVLLVLAAMFTRYSSTAVFGTALDSPLVLRYFASALIDKAYALALALFKSEKFEASAQFKDWTNRLLGQEKAFSCTAVLSNMMIRHIKEHFSNVLTGIMPPVWL